MSSTALSRGTASLRPFAAPIGAAFGALALVFASPAGAQELNLYTYREPALIKPLIDAFTKETGVKVNTDPDFKGFHKVEGLIFRDEDLDAARPVAQELEGSLEELVRDLATRENFSAKKTFEGLQALANEIGAKKISSEEETWSDRSLLIFRYNLVGIDSQFRPFAAALAAKNAAAADGVARAYRQAAAAVDAVYGGEPGGRPYSSVRVAERRAVVQGAYAYRDALAKAAETLGLD